MKIHESGEDYLETILILESQKGYVRSIDIASERGFSKPSVSRAMNILKNADLITMDDEHQIHLTDKGRIKANQIYDRHRLITRFFIEILGVDSVTAEQDACRIEHVISQKTFDKIKEYLPKTPQNKAK
jgi:Mn-dependent DtxR family transcriptional regulator